MPRLLKKLLLWLGLLGFLAATTAGFWLPPIISHAVDRDYHFSEVAIDATVLPNGDLQLVERRTFDFRNGPFTYAYYTVEDPLDHVRDFTIAELRPDGIEAPVEPGYAGHDVPTGAFQARWSYEANDEERTWVFRYRVEGAVDVYRDTAHLYWQFIGTGWDEPTSHAIVTLHLPNPGSQEGARAWGHGPLNGEVTIVDPRTIRYEVHDVPPLSFVEGSVVFPTSWVPQAAIRPESKLPQILDQERRWAEEADALRRRHDAQRLWVIVLLIAVPLALPLFALIAALRDRIREVPRLLEEPPEPDAVQASLLWSAWRGHLSPQNAYRAQLLHLARVDAIELRAEGLVTDPKDITLVRKADPSELDTAADQDFMELLFGKGDDAALEVSVNHPKPRTAGSAPFSRYQRWWTDVRSRSREVIRRIQKGDARFESVGASALAVGAAGYGIWTATWGVGGPIGWWLPPLGAVCLIAVLRVIPARVDRPLRERIAKLAAFRRYLRSFSDLPNAPTLAVIIWEQYLEWASALGVADEVEKQVKTLVPVDQLRSPIPGGPSGLAGVNLVNGLSAAAPSIVLASMASVSSSGSTSGGFGSFSSSGGFSSGGFSGGGGGGGGGTGGGAG